jgi:hypothetical protein
LPDASGTVDEDLVETALVGLVGIFITEMPFAKDPSRVSRRSEDLREDGRIEGHPLSLEDGVGDPVLHRVTTRHEGGASRRTGRADEEAVESRRGIVEGIQIRRANPGMAVFPDWSVSLVVGDDEDDVGLRPGELRGCRSKRHQDT